MTSTRTKRNSAFYKKNLRRVLAETILTSIGAGFCIPVMTIFYESIGMNQTDIGITQMGFTIIVCFLDIPMGYVADRFNRKTLNIIGDFGVALSFFVYSLAQNMYMCLLAETLLAIFSAMTNGVDQAFLKYNCYELDESGELFKKLNAKAFTARYVALLVSTILGSLIAKYSIRASILAAFFPYLAGGIISFTIVDTGEKAKGETRNLFIDMLKTLKKILSKKTTRTLLYSNILGNEITHPQVWVFTPLLLFCGVPIEIVSSGWVLYYIMQTLGGKLSERMVGLKYSKKFIIPMAIEISWMIVLIVHTNIVTIWLFALNGLVHGLISGHSMSALQESVEDEYQTSLVSVASTCKRLMYIPLVYFINYLGDIKLQYSLVGMCVIFIPLCTIVYFMLKRFEKSECS